MSIRLIVGLGNPGPEYEQTRHNAGFWLVDNLAGPVRLSREQRFNALAGKTSIAGNEVWLLEPQTYMNLSGASVGEAAKFYKVPPEDILVIHDEVDLAPGKIRMKAGGGSAGHNGLRSISGAIGDNYRRLRLGIGHPGVKEMVPIHVLHDFHKADRDWLVPLLDAIADNAALLAEGKDAVFANRLHAQLRETLSVLRWTGSGPHSVWVKDSPDTLALTYRLGAVLPLLSTASGQVCLAFAPQDEVSPLLAREWPRRRAELGPQFNRWSLQDLVAEVRRRRLARGRNYLHRVSAVSTPLFDTEHRFWGVLTALGPSSRFPYGWRGPAARGLHAFGLAHPVPEHFVDSLRVLPSHEPGPGAAPRSLPR